MGDDRSITYSEDSTIIYRASSIGHCIRQLVLSRRGYDPIPYPPNILTAFAQGNEWEPKVINHLRKNNWSIKADQPEINLQVLPNIIVRGHLDGTGHHFIDKPKSDFGIPGVEYIKVQDGKWRTNKLGIEVKALSSDNYSKFIKSGLDAFPSYKWQLSCYMLGTGLPFAMVVVDKGESDDDRISYTVRCFQVPPISKADILRRVITVEKYVRDQSLPPCEPDSFFCPFNPYHDDSSSKKPTITVTDGSQINLIRQYNQRSSDIKTLQLDQKHLKELILKSFDKGDYSGGGFKWSISHVHKDEYVVKPQDFDMLRVGVDNAK